MKEIVCYFSATGTTKLVAQNISEILNTDIFEIVPQELYTKEDLDWRNKESRTSIEMKDENSRPKIKEKLKTNNYDKIYLGFPVWWYTAPTIINTFIEENDLANKNIYVFVTSGGSSVDDSFNNLKNKYPNLKFIKGIRLTQNDTKEKILEWSK